MPSDVNTSFSCPAGKKIKFNSIGADKEYGDLIRSKCENNNSCDVKGFLPDLNGYEMSINYACVDGLEADMESEQVPMISIHEDTSSNGTHQQTQQQPSQCSSNKSVIEPPMVRIPSVPNQLNPLNPFDSTREGGCIFDIFSLNSLCDMISFMIAKMMNINCCSVLVLLVILALLLYVFSTSQYMRDKLPKNMLGGGEMTTFKLNIITPSDA